MRVYFDSAYIAKCYLNEPDSTRVRRAARQAEGLYSSMFAVAEISCVLLRNLREGSLSTKQADLVRNLFLKDIQTSIWNLLPVSDGLFYRLEGFVRTLPADVYLRAGEGVHLITAREAGFREVWSNDRQLLRAASYFGLEGKTVR